MMLNEEEKQYALKEYLRNISNLQDKEYQSRIWIRGEGPECQAFDDAVCDFFDIGDPILEDYRDFGITEDQFKVLKKLREEFRIFADENDFPEEFISSLKWSEIMNLARNVLNAFNYQKM